MRIRRTTTLLATLIGASVLALPMAAHAAVPFDEAGDDDATTDVPDTIDSLDLAATRDQSVYQITVSYDDLEKTATTQRFAILADRGAKAQASRIRGNIVELRTNRKSEVSVHLYDYYVSESAAAITPTTCKGLAVVANYDKDTIRYTLPRSCYFGVAKPVSAEINAEDGLFNDTSWDPAATFDTSSQGTEPDSNDSIAGQWVFNPESGQSMKHTSGRSLQLFRG